MCENNNDFDFEPVYNKFYGPIEEIHKRLKDSTDRIPTIEKRIQKIKRLSKTQCSFALMDELDIDKISPVKKLPFRFKGKEISNKEFFRHIHPAYLIPYIIFAKFAYALPASIEAKPEEILDACYKMLLPLKLYKENDYSWYIQYAHPPLNQQPRSLSCHIISDASPVHCLQYN